jgi:hypothetical protein
MSSILANVSAIVAHRFQEVLADSPDGKRCASLALDAYCARRDLILTRVNEEKTLYVNAAVGCRDGSALRHQG